MTSSFNARLEDVRVSQGFKFESLRNDFFTTSSTLERKPVPLGIMESKVRARSQKDQNLKTRELGSMVLQWQGPRIKTLREGGSFWCCLSKASCSFLFL
jgi:hypothetical protein